MNCLTLAVCVCLNAHAKLHTHTRMHVTRPHKHQYTIMYKNALKASKEQFFIFLFLDSQQ